MLVRQCVKQGATVATPGAIGSFIKRVASGIRPIVKARIAGPIWPIPKRFVRGRDSMNEWANAENVTWYPEQKQVPQQFVPQPGYWPGRGWQ